MLDTPQKKSWTKDFLLNIYPYSLEFTEKHIYILC